VPDDAVDDLGEERLRLRFGYHEAKIPFIIAVTNPTEQ
jgi:hypothetical protein